MPAVRRSSAIWADHLNAGNILSVFGNGCVAADKTGNAKWRPFSFRRFVMHKLLPLKLSLGVRQPVGQLHLVINGGDMLCRTVFSVVNKAADDTLSVTWTITLAAS